MADSSPSQDAFAAARKADQDLVAAIHTAYLDVAKGSLDRAIQRGNTLTAAATVIATADSGLLALRFSADKGQPLPAYGFASLIFLAISMLCNGIYAAFLSREQKNLSLGELLPSAVGTTEIRQQRLTTFFQWTFAGVLARSWALRTGVVSLGLAIALIPLPFATRNWATIAIGVAGVVLALWLIGEALLRVSEKFTDPLRRCRRWCLHKLRPGRSASSPTSSASAPANGTETVPARPALPTPPPFKDVDDA
jgi:hypothetical protein